MVNTTAGPPLTSLADEARYPLGLDGPSRAIHPEIDSIPRRPGFGTTTNKNNAGLVFILEGTMDEIRAPSGAPVVGSYCCRHGSVCIRGRGYDVKTVLIYIFVNLIYYKNIKPHDTRKKKGFL